MLKVPAPLRNIALAVCALALAAGTAGCGAFDSAFGQQWIVVTFAPNTSVATARHVALACSHIPNLPLEGKVRPDTGEAGVVSQVQYDAANATDAEMARLEQCLSRFPAIVQGFTEMDQGDSG